MSNAPRTSHRTNAASTDEAASAEVRPLLELIDVSMQYGSIANASGAPVLRRINLSVMPGQSLAIMGPSGSGKSTLLNIIGTLDRPTGGRVMLDGVDLAAKNEAQLAQVRNDRIGFVFQSHHLLPQCTALENVLLPTLVHRDASARATAHERARHLLERVGLTDRMHHRPGELSGGERQRVALVRAMINRPALLLADEPTGALDRRRADELADLLVALNEEQRVTLIVVTHTLTLAQRMQQVYELVDGELVAGRAGDA